MTKVKSKVMTIANRLVKQGLTRSIATVKAWVIVKANALRTKVRGTSRRQETLEKLAGINPKERTHLMNLHSGFLFRIMTVQA